MASIWRSFQPPSSTTTWSNSNPLARCADTRSNPVCRRRKSRPHSASQSLNAATGHLNALVLQGEVVGGLAQDVDPWAVVLVHRTRLPAWRGPRTRRRGRRARRRARVFRADARTRSCPRERPRRAGLPARKGPAPGPGSASAVRSRRPGASPSHRSTRTAAGVRQTDACAWATSSADTPMI